MRYEHTTKGIAALGRNGDDTLLHVKKSELAGLQALLGPVTTNPHTGLPEAFNWTDILASLGIGIAGALTGGAAAAAVGPELGALAGTATGAGTGALLGGGISAAEGKGFGPGAIGGLISGGMGGYGGVDLPGGATPAPAETTTMSDMTGWPQVKPGATPSSTWDQFTSNLGTQASGMATKPGMEALMKPVGLGAMLGYGATTTAEQANAGAAQLRAAKLQQAQANQENANYFSSLGLPLPSGSAGTSSDPNTQRNYFTNLVYGAAAGGPIEMHRNVGGVPIQTTVPAKFVSQFEKITTEDNLDPAIKNLQAIFRNQGYATGGYVNTTPFNANQFYPQSRIQGAQPYAGAGNTGVINTLSQGASFAAGGSAYEKGGFLDGPGDGMSDDIPANIDGREEIRLADGEYVVPPELVSLIGSGNPEEGKHLLNQLLPMVRQAAHGKKEQVKQDAGKLAVEKLLTRKKAKGDARRSGIEAAG